MFASTLRLIRERVQPSDLQLGPTTVAWALATPLLHRVARGEGLLLAVNFSISLLAASDGPALFAQLFVSTATLALLYFLNDLHDCHGDLNDEHKDAVFVGFLVEHRARLFAILLALKLCLVLVTFALLGLPAALAVTTVSLVNLAYSFRLKGLPVLDVGVVAIWGAAYAAVPGVALPWTLPVLVGVMTGICHVFQMWRDRDVDAVNSLHTSAVTSPWLPVAELSTLCLALGAILHHQLGPIAAASAALPLALHFGLKSNQAAWLLSKLHYAVVWLLVISTLGRP